MSLMTGVSYCCILGNNVIIASFPLEAFALDWHDFEGVILSIYGMNHSELDSPGKVCKFQKPEEVLQLLNVEDAKFYMDIIILGIFLSPLGWQLTWSYGPKSSLRDNIYLMHSHLLCQVLYGFQPVCYFSGHFNR